MKIKIIIPVFLLMILGCTNPTGPSFSTFSYPLKVGNTWEYERTMTYRNVQPDTIELWFPHIIKGSAVIQVSAVDSLSDSSEVYVLSAVAIDSLNPQFVDSSEFSFRNEEDGLYEYGNTGGNLAVPISRPPSESEIINRFLKNYKQLDTHAVSIHADAKQTIKYPIALNSTWVFLDETDNIFGIEKKIIRFEVLQTKTGRYLCFVVQWKYSNTSVTVIDYVSKIGLMKRSISIQNVSICNLNLTACATADITDEYVLVEHSIE